jgi:hypothetical protein
LCHDVWHDTAEYTHTKHELGPIAGLTRDQSTGPNSDLLIQLPGRLPDINIGDSASGPTIIDLDRWN